MSTNDANHDALSCCQGCRLPVTSLPTSRTAFRAAAPAPRTSFVVLTLIFIGLSGLEYLYHNEFMQQQKRQRSKKEAQTTCRCHKGGRSGTLTTNTHRLDIDDDDDDAAAEVAVLCLFGKFPGPDVPRTLVMASAMAVAHDYTVQSVTNSTVNTTFYTVGLMSATWSAWYQDFFDDTLIDTKATNTTNRAPTRTTMAAAAVSPIKARRKSDWSIDMEGSSSSSGSTLYVPPVVLDYKGGNCAEFLDPAVLLERYFGHSNNINGVAFQMLQALQRPRLAYRQRAEAMLSNWTRTADTLARTSFGNVWSSQTARPQYAVVTTVHRAGGSSTDGDCRSVAYSNAYSYCPPNTSSRSSFANTSTVTERLAICDWSHARILADMEKQDEDQSDSRNATRRRMATRLPPFTVRPVVLFTDGYVPQLDQSFPIVVGLHDYPLAVQVWMMVVSDVHFGSPFPMTDLVVYAWWQAYHREQEYGNGSSRRWERVPEKRSVAMRPVSCYP